jgi:hypothetical protein
MPDASTTPNPWSARKRAAGLADRDGHADASGSALPATSRARPRRVLTIPGHARCALSIFGRAALMNAWGVR